MNAKDFGVPQNRERCFMLSWLGEDKYYDFPVGKPLTKKLKDVLETEVEEKYYLSSKAIKSLNLDAIDDGLRGDSEAISKTVRAGGRGSLDRHCWDIVVESRQED